MEDGCVEIVLGFDTKDGELGLVAEFTVSDFIATLNYHSHVEADDYGHSLTPPRQICRT